MRYIQRILTRWSSASRHARRRAKWGVVTDPHRSGWDADHSGTDLLGVMVRQDRDRKNTPKPRLP